MRHCKIKLISIAAVLVFLLAPHVGIAQPPVDHTIYGDLLSGNVSNGVVDYKAFKQNEARLDQYLSQLGNISPENLTPVERMAFYINLYNAWTIKLILTRYPDIKSIKDTGSLFSSPWDKKIVVLENKKVSLDHIEHDLLRPQYQDPRIHFAVNCASKSCPPLLGEPYTGDHLEDQLDQVTAAFINNGKSNYIRDDTLYVSRIFKWYAEDFKDGILNFFLKYAKDDFKQELKKHSSKVEIKYLDYDWSLNGK